MKKMKKTGSIFLPGLEEYINQNLISRPHPFFLEIEKFAEENTIPILSPSSGSLLAKLIDWLQPKSILELGTGAGYSLHWMVSKIQTPVSITTVDRNREIFPIIQEFWEVSPYKEKHSVKFQPGHIVEQLQNGSLNPLDYDFIFIDSDKITYPDLIQIFEEKWKLINERKFSKQYLLFDNVLWHGRLMNPDPNKTSDLALTEFWKYVKERKFEETLIPAGDGLLLIELT
ncbi:MAG: O-methyltransferase [Leptospira sp.]|nr:O-methyltransferase [Leptospira sp.]